MGYFKKNYLFFLLTIIIIFFHQYIFQSFFPNKNLLLGNDYSIALPNFIFGKIWFNNNLLSIPWFSPSFCCGTPFFADPQTMYYSLQQLFFIFFSPLLALKIMFLFFSLISFLGVFFFMHKSFKKNIYISLISARLKPRRLPLRIRMRRPRSLRLNTRLRPTRVGCKRSFDP